MQETDEENNNHMNNKKLQIPCLFFLLWFFLGLFFFLWLFCRCVFDTNQPRPPSTTGEKQITIHWFILDTYHGVVALPSSWIIMGA